MLEKTTNKDADAGSQGKDSKKPLRVLLVSHTCMSRTMGQPKVHSLAAYPDLELTVVVPDRMNTYGEWQDAEAPHEAAFRFVAGRTRWQNLLQQWYLLHYPDTLGRVLSETQPDVVDIWEEPWGLVTAQTIWLTRLLCPQAKIVVESEQNIFKRLPPPFAQFQRYSLKHADRMIARTRDAQDVLRRKGYGGPVEVVPNAVDADAFQPATPEQRAQSRAALGWGAPEDFVFGYVGRLVPEKGLADALEALRLLPESVRFAIVGAGPMQPELERLARAAGVEKRVVFAGQKTLTEMPQAMQALDALILPSRTTPHWKEQFGRVLIEAGACGVPVIGSDSGAIPSVVADAGLVFPEGDAAALAQWLVQLQQDPSLARALGANGQMRARRLFSWQRVAAQMHSIYREMLSDGAMQFVAADPVPVTRRNRLTAAVKHLRP